MRLRDFWRDLPRWAKVSFWISIALGLVCFAAGLYGDAHSFWGSRSYGVNMFTSLTGALFGVPFAAVLVTWFTTSLEGRLSRTSAETLTISTWSEIKELLEAHLGLIDPDSLRANAKLFAEQLEKAKAIFVPVHDHNYWKSEQQEESDFAWAKEESDARFAEDIQALKVALLAMEEPWKALMGPLSHAGTINSNWAALRGKWQFLSNTVKAQRLAAGLRWDMPEHADSVFSLHLAAGSSPLDRPLGQIFFGRGKSWVVALGEILTDQETSPLAAWRILKRAELRYFEPDGITGSATTAANTLRSLQAALREVEAAGWPDGHTPR